MSNVIVLGAGMVGSAMAIDMAKKHQVILTDKSQSVLSKVKKMQRSDYPSVGCYK